APARLPGPPGPVPRRGGRAPRAVAAKGLLRPDARRADGRLRRRRLPPRPGRLRALGPRPRRRVRYPPGGVRMSASRPRTDDAAAAIDALAAVARTLAAEAASGDVFARVVTAAKAFVPFDWIGLCWS